MYLPVPLFVYLLLVASWRGQMRRLLPHAVASVVLFYTILGGYIYINATQNHFVGVTWIQNINELGKVVQYTMQDEASPRYSGISRTIDRDLAKGIRDPWDILGSEPSLSHNNAALAGAYSQSIIVHHPVEFLRKSVPIFFSSLTIFQKQTHVVPIGPFGPFIAWLEFVFRVL